MLGHAFGNPIDFGNSPFLALFVHNRFRPSHGSLGILAHDFPDEPLNRLIHELTGGKLIEPFGGGGRVLAGPLADHFLHALGSGFPFRHTANPFGCLSRVFSRPALRHVFPHLSFDLGLFHAINPFHRPAQILSGDLLADFTISKILEGSVGQIFSPAHRDVFPFGPGSLQENGSGPAS